MKPIPDSGPGKPRLLGTGTLKTHQLPVNDGFADSVTRPLPAGYFIPASESGIVSLLRLHGIQVIQLSTNWTDSVQVLGPVQAKWAEREFQGHHQLAVSGTWTTSRRTIPAGTYFVSTAQPLGRLVFSLLEPEGWGLSRWGLFDRLLGSEFGTYSGLVYGSGAVAEFPVARAIRAPRVAGRVVP